MPLWKQRQFTRLMKPIDGEGSDLGGGASATETAIDAVGVSDAPADTTETPADTSADPQPGDTTDTSTTSDETAKPGSRMAAMLDELTDDPNQAKPDTKPAEAATKPAEGVTKPAESETPPNAEQEESELLEGVKSERGRERIKQVFAERKQLEQDITEFRDLVKSTGMSAQEFAQTLEFGRLLNSGDEKNLRVALEMIEGQRSMLYQKLGVEAPGIDLLAGHDDLKAAVDNMEITRDRAVELAKFRKVDSEAKAREQAQQTQVQERQVYEKTVKDAAGAMEAYLETRKNEVDHTARMKVISDHFRNPANLQKFVGTYRPEQWAATVQMMYDNIQVPRAAAPGPQPIRSRPATLGTPATNAATPIDRIAQRMESMGI
jgi:hypothetical protein